MYVCPKYPPILCSRPQATALHSTPQMIPNNKVDKVFAQVAASHFVSTFCCRLIANLLAFYNMFCVGHEDCSLCLAFALFTLVLPGLPGFVLHL